MNASKIAIVVVALVAGTGAVVLARRYQRPDPPKDPEAPGMKVGSDSVTLEDNAPAWKAIKLATPKPSEPHWTDAMPARIQFDETHTSRVGAPLAGRVTSVMVERGQHVKAGATLFTVASGSLAEMRNDQAKAALDLEVAKDNADRVQRLVDAGSIPAKELVAAKAQVRQAELAVQVAQQKLSSLRVSGSDTSFSVTAPRDGVVVEKTVNVGMQVDTSQPSLVAIADLAEVWVVADLFETDVGGLTPGAKAKVIVGKSELEASVDQISAIVDPDRHTVPVRVRLANAEGLLRPNAYAQVKFYDPDGAKVTLPAGAVMSDGAQSYVYAKNDKGALSRRNITVGAISNGIVPVLDGLALNDQVVIQGGILLDNQIQLDN